MRVLCAVLAFSLTFSKIVTSALALPNDYEDKASRLVRTFFGRAGPVLAVAFSPDGRLAVSGSSDNSAQLWDIATGKQLCNFAGHSGSVNAVTFTPSGKTVVSGSYDDTLKSWDTDTCREIRTFKGHSGSVNALAVTPDELAVVSASSDCSLKLWNLGTGELIRTFIGHDTSIVAVAISPGGHLILSSDLDDQGARGNQVKLWDLNTGKEVRTFAGRSLSVSSVEFFPDGRRALTGGGQLGKLKVWDVRTGHEIEPAPFTMPELLNGQFRRFNADGPAAISHDGRYIVSSGCAMSPGYMQACGSGYIRVVTPDGEILGELSGEETSYPNVPHQVKFSPDSHFALSASGSTLKLWDISEWTQP